MQLKVMIFSFKINQIKKISIRGRLAFGVCCIEQYKDENHIENKWIERLIDELWKFTYSEKLDEWKRKIRDLEPIDFLGQNQDNQLHGAFSVPSFFAWPFKFFGLRIGL